MYMDDHQPQRRRSVLQIVTVNQIRDDVSYRHKYHEERTWCFDLDDTLLFSSGAFDYWRDQQRQKRRQVDQERAERKLEQPGKGQEVKKGQEEKEQQIHQQGQVQQESRYMNYNVSNMDMWDFVNGPGLSNRYTVPKNVTMGLLRFMLNLSSIRIVIITNRCSSNLDRLYVDAKSIADSLIRATNMNRSVYGVFPIHQYDVLIRLVDSSNRFNDLIVTLTCEQLRRRDKVTTIKMYKCERMFGDSDDDIRSCLLGNDRCVPFRVLRSPSSSYKGPYHVDLYGETILANSVY